MAIRCLEMSDRLRFILDRLSRLLCLPGQQQRERRRNERHRSPSLTVTIEGRTYKTVDWSLGGMRLPRFHRALAPGEQLQGKMHRFGGAPSGPFAAAVVYASEGHGVGLRLTEITPALFMAMGTVRAH